MPDSVAYRLRKGLSIHTNGTHSFLVSTFPLQAIGLDRAWHPVLAHLAAGEAINNHHRNLLPHGVTPAAAKMLFRRLAQNGYLIPEADLDDWALPSFSVIVPVRNRAKDLSDCLASLSDLDYPPDKIEVLVIDDASTDDTPEVALTYPVRLIRNAGCRGASGSRNRGARQAMGDILCFVDSDCRATSRWLRELAVLFQDPAVVAGGGGVGARLTQTALDRYEQVQSALHMGDRPRDSRSGDRFFYQPSCNLAIRRDAFLAVDGFNEALSVGEDVDLCWRLIDAGGAIGYRPEAKVYHRHRNYLSAFCRRRFEYGTSEPLLQSMHRGRRKTVPLFAIAALFWLLLALTIWRPLFAIPALGMLLGDALWCRTRSSRSGLDLGYLPILSARIRHFMAALYALAAFGSRYYLVVAVLLLSMGASLPAGFLLISHISVAMVRYTVNPPRLDPIRFLFFFSMEQLSYQTGVWWACARLRFFAPVMPRIGLRWA